MSARTVSLEPSWEGFRAAARGLLRDGVLPQRVGWVEAGEEAEQLGLLAALPPPPAGEEGAAAPVARVPRRLVQLGETAACHRDPAPWPWLYRVLWRVTRGERALLDDPADPDVAALLAMERAVRRDAHKMTAFVRFRAVRDGEGERFVAWFEPRHRVVRRTAPFFRRRFPAMRWSILTPDECVHWDGETLRFTAGVGREAAPEGDALEAFWLTYYRNTFNPARVRVRAMRAEMPVHYWRNLPEAAAIDALLREAPERVRRMVEEAGAPRDPEAAARAARRSARLAQRERPADGPAER